MCSLLFIVLRFGIVVQKVACPCAVSGVLCSGVFCHTESGLYVQECRLSV